MVIEEIKKILISKGYEFIDGMNPYQLNIIGIRNDDSEANSFDDNIVCIYRDNQNHWCWHRWRATTDPGLYWLNKPLNVEGAAILAEGQYKNCYRLGMHRQKYLALVQSGPVKVIRDYNRDSKLDFNSDKIQEGLFGINIHKASNEGVSSKVDKWSAGCQVFASSFDFTDFIVLCKKHREIYGNSFSYTLINTKDFEADPEPRGIEKMERKAAA